MEKLRSFYDREIVLHATDDSFTADGQLSRWSNKDLDPVPRDQKKWEWYHVAGFWIVAGFTPSHIQQASTNVALGLSPGLILGAYLIGNLVVAVPVALSGYIGAKDVNNVLSYVDDLVQYSVNYPVIARASFGMWGSYVPIIIRLAVSPVWYGIGTYLGSLALLAMIEAIWPDFSTWHQDAFSASANITAAKLLCFAIFWLASIPLMFVSMPALRWVFLAKIVIMPILGVCLFTWAVTASHGFGPLLSIPSKTHDGVSVGYAFCYAITTAITGCATYTVWMPDILRFADKPRQISIAQAIALPVIMTLIYFLGVVLAASSQVVYGHVVWNPLELVLLWDNRAAKFFVGLIWAFAAIIANVTSISLASGNDLMGLFPGYMNLRRGQLLCAIVGFAVCPWEIEASATRFLAFAQGFTIPFLGPIAGVLLCDYFVVRRRSGLNVYQLYKPHGLYWYHAGWNFRAVLALLVGMTPQLPSLAYGINRNLVGISRQYVDLSSMGWLEAFMFSFLAYYALYLLAPFPCTTDEEDKAAWAIALREVSRSEGEENGLATEEVKDHI